MICSTCQVDKPDTDFHWKKVGVKRQVKCKMCSRAYGSAHYQNNKAAYKASNRRRGVAIRDYVRGLKENTPCADCGGVFHFSVMEYDHINNDKIASVSRLVNNRALSWQRVKEEIAKCELVCANCHRLRTWKRRHLPVSSNGKAHSL